MKMSLLLALLVVSVWGSRAEDLLDLAAQGLRHDDLRKALRDLKTGINDLRDNDGKTALHFSAQGAQYEDSLLLLQAGANPNIADVLGRTPLFYALEQRRQENALLTAQLLVLAGADVNHAAKDGSTPLSTAVEMRSREAVEFLLESGAAVECAGTSLDQQPLAIARDLEDTAIVALLQAAKTAVAEKKTETHAPSEDINRRFLAATRAGDLPTIKTLLRQGADINCRDDQGATALYRAINEHRPEVMTLLLLHKADPNAAKDDGMTPLMAAPQYFDIAGTSAMVLLFQAGANVNAVTKDGRTPLSEAVVRRNNFAAKWCLWKGANLDVKTPEGTLMQLAKARKDWPSMIALLKANGVRDDEARPPAPEEAIFDAVRAGNVAAVQRELDHGIRPDVADARGAPLISWAAHYDRFNIVDLLIKGGAKVDQRNAKTSKTAFQEFALYGRGSGDAKVAAHTMEELVKRGADPNAVTDEGLTALMLAARTGAIGPNLDYLLKVTADINRRSKEGKTALGLAREYGHREVAEKLVTKGAVE